MRWFLGLWFAPLAIFWGWYFASAADLGAVFFTRHVHDQTFAIYGNMLGIDPALIPVLVAKACIFDSILVLGIYAFARRKRIGSWLRARRERAAAPALQPDTALPSAASLSSAP